MRRVSACLLSTLAVTLFIAVPSISRSQESFSGIPSGGYAAPTRLPPAAPSTYPAPAIMSNTDPLLDLHRRVQALEQENQLLRSQSAPSVIPTNYAAEASVNAQDGGGISLFDLQSQLRTLQQAYQADRNTLPRIRINGVFQADQGWFQQDSNSRNTFGHPLFPGDTVPPQPGGGHIQDGGDFRRTRLAASGQVTENMNGFLQMDFAFFGRPTFTDVWGEYTNLPYLGAVRVGQWKQPFSLEVYSSFRYTTFAERSLLFQAFAPFRHLAAGFYNTYGDLRGTYAASIYKAGQDQYGDSLSTAGGNAAVGRITYLPYYDEPSGGRYYTHIGGAYAFVNPENNLTRFRTSPEIYIGEVVAPTVGTSGQNVNGLANGTPFFVDTGNIHTKGYSEFGSELLWVRGPLSIQSEAMAVVVPQSNGNTLNYWGGYAYVSYFLTGEHRPYDRKLGVYDRPIPFENFFRVRGMNRGICTGIGAWEVAARISYIDLNSGLIQNVGQSNHNPTTGGGRLTDGTAGLNWYLNPYSKLTFNYIRAMLNNNTFGYSNTNVFDLRYQMDF